MRPPFHFWLSYWIRSYNVGKKQVLVFRRRNVFNDNWKTLTVRQVNDLYTYLSTFGEVTIESKDDYVLFFFKSFKDDYTLDSVYNNFIDNDWHEINDDESSWNYDIEDYDDTFDFIAEVVETIIEGTEEETNDGEADDPFGAIYLSTLTPDTINDYLAQELEQLSGIQDKSDEIIFCDEWDGEADELADEEEYSALEDNEPIPVAEDTVEENTSSIPDKAFEDNTVAEDTVSDDSAIEASTDSSHGTGFFIPQTEEVRESTSSYEAPTSSFESSCGCDSSNCSGCGDD